MFFILNSTQNCFQFGQHIMNKLGSTNLNVGTQQKYFQDVNFFLKIKGQKLKPGFPTCNYM